MSKTTFWDIIEKTLEKVGTPLSAKEIWEKANELGTIGEYRTEGKTPWATIAAYCYTDINRGGDKSMIIQTSERPAQFFLRRLSKYINIDEITERKEEQKIKEEIKIEKKFHERDLHAMLVTFTNTDTHFKAYLKTIFHENSKKGIKGLNEWLHPDLVGVYFPFRDYRKETLEIQHHLSISSIRLFSFEVKINLTFTNLREYYFQVVSNSSWANEGYLVTLKLDEDPTLKDEIRRLNNAFGIGVIKLNPENVYESEILFPSRYNQEIDWDTVNRLATENSDFSSFLNELTEDITLKKVKSKYDSILSPDDIEKYIKEKGIKG
jgi:hypothetical protein